jgi:hypothetical protein
MSLAASWAIFPLAHLVTLPLRFIFPYETSFLISPRQRLHPDLRAEGDLARAGPQADGDGAGRHHRGDRRGRFRNCRF